MDEVKRVHIRLPQGLYERALQCANEIDRDMSYLMKCALIIYLQRFETKKGGAGRVGTAVDT